MTKEEDENVNMIIKTCNEHGKECINSNQSEISIQNMNLTSNSTKKEKTVSESVHLSL